MMLAVAIGTKQTGFVAGVISSRTTSTQVLHYLPPIVGFKFHEVFPQGYSSRLPWQCCE